MLPLTLGHAKKLLASRLRGGPGGRTPAEPAARAGLSMATVARLERAGQLASFFQLLTALGRLPALEG